MKYRILGKTGLSVSEIGFGGEWLCRHEEAEAENLIRYAGERGINIIDCWMPDAKSRDIIGNAICDNRDQWYVQGHIGSTEKDGQYYRTREMAYVKPAFEDLLTRLKTEYIDLGMIHYVDSEKEWEEIQNSDYLAYVFELKKEGKIRHIGMSSHNPKTALAAAESGFVEMILFSINPAFDMLPSTDNVADVMFADTYDAELHGVDPDRVALYDACVRNNVGITVMKGFAGGRLLNASASPFGIALTPVQCMHYALTRPAAVSVLVGYDTTGQIDSALAYENASDEEKDFDAALAGAPAHSFSGKCMYCNHCKPCPADIDIAMVNKLYDLAVMQEQTPASLREHYRALGHNADDCIGCGSCETRCPFGVRIRERMDKARQLFG